MRAALLLASFVVVGCGGPRGSPGGSVKSFFSALESENWNDAASIASDQSLKKVGSRERAAAAMAHQYSGWTKVDVTIKEELIDSDGRGATVVFDCISTQIENYKEKKYDCSDTWMLVKQDDGKWHLHLPGTNRLRPLK